MTIRPEYSIWKMRGIDSVQTKDTSGLDMLLAPELVYVDTDGQLMTKVEYLGSVQSQLEHAERVTSESMKVHVFGTACIRKMG